MAPTKKQKQIDLSAIGTVGRKTGVTLGDLGPRNAHGLEPIEDLYSSPRKGPTPQRPNGAIIHSGSETMVLANGTPDDASSILRSARQTLVPPRSRSPIKTAIGGKPRRSVALLSSPSQSRESRSSRSSLAAPPRRSMNLNGSQGINGFEEEAQAALKSKPLWRGASVPKPAGRPRKQSYNLLDDDDDEEEVEEAGTEQADEDQDDEDSSAGEETGQSPKDRASSAELEDETVGEPDEVEDQLPETNGGFNDDDDDVPLPEEVDEHIEEILEDSPLPEAPPVKQGKKRKSPERDINTDIAQAEQQNRPVKKRGRPPKQKASATVEDDTEQDDAPQEEASQDEETMPPPKTKRGRGPANRNPKARISSTKSRQRYEGTPLGQGAQDAVEVFSESETTKKAKKKPRARQMPHLQETREDEVEDVVPVVLRSGRTSVKPLDYWRGEHIMYEPPKRIGQSWQPGGFGGIDPGRRNAESKLRAAARRRPGRRRGTTKEPEDIKDEHEELWETEGDTPGVLNAGVLAWDSELQRGTEDAYEEVELAVTANALEGRLQWDKAKTFKFGKTLTLPFFHSGIVDLPPGGEKRPKNSRKNHMIFWVFSGRVQVDISGTEFSIGRGGMWQVPRGNLYGLTNPFEESVRIFFAQGSYMEQPEDEAALLAAANGLG